MKKNSIIIIILLCVSSITAHSQIKKGNYLIGVSSSLSLSDNNQNLLSIGFTSAQFRSDVFGQADKDKTRGINILPRIGYFFSDNLVAGLDISLGYNNEITNHENTIVTSKLIAGGPFIKYYFPMGKVYPFIELGGSIGGYYVEYKENYMDVEIESIILNGNAGLGIAFPVGDRSAFELMAGYNGFIIKESKDNPDNDRTVIESLGLKFGFSIYL